MTKQPKRTIEDELRLVQGNKDILHPADVVEWAKSNPDSLLFAQFEWDDAKAANEHRIWQARRLIALHVVTEGGERKTVSLVVDRSKGGGYRQIEDVVRVPQLRDAMLLDALAELRRVKARYAHLKELVRVFEEIERADAAYGKGQVA